MKRKFIFLIICGVQSAFAQFQQWVDTVSYPDKTAIIDVCVHSNNIYSAGGFWEEYHSWSTPGSFVKALAPDGSQVWLDTTMNRSNTVSSIYSNNSIFVFGNAGSEPLHFGSFTLHPLPPMHQSSYVVKYDLNGNVLSAVLLNDIIVRKAEMWDGQIYFLGTCINCTISGTSAFKNLLAKIDTNCAVTWSQLIPGSQAVDFALGGTDCLYVGTQTGSSYTQEIRRYDGNGNLVWSHTPGLFFNSLSADSLGNCYVSGVSGTNAVINKFDTSGYITESFYPPGMQIVEKVFCFGHSFYAFGMPDNESYNMVKYSDGVMEYLFPIGGAKVLCMEKVGTDLYLGGWYPYPASQQACLIKIAEGSTTNVTAPTIESSSLSVYPNPSSALFTLEFKTDYPEKVSLKVRNAKGQLLINEVLSPQANEVRKELDLRSYATGVYTVELVQGKSRVMKKIVLE